MYVLEELYTSLSSRLGGFLAEKFAEILSLCIILFREKMNSKLSKKYLI